MTCAKASNSSRFRQAFSTPRMLQQRRPGSGNSRAETFVWTRARFAAKTGEWLRETARRGASVGSAVAAGMFSTTRA
jgi:hypothetical protein